MINKMEFYEQMILTYNSLTFLKLKEVSFFLSYLLSLSHIIIKLYENNYYF
jgi:hypothetical protein